MPSSTPSNSSQPVEVRFRRRTSLLLAAAAALITPLVTVPSAAAAPSLSITRVDGESRYATAVTASQRNYSPTTGRTVLLASGTSTVDALSASYVAGSYNSPVLLTEPDAIDSATINELRRLGATRVIIAGGETAVGPEVAGILRQSFTVDRADGIDRYDTAAKLTALVQAADPAVVFVAAGSGAPDAAAASPLAAANGWPILLTGKDGAPTSTRAALRRYPAARVVVLGGEDSVTAATANALGASSRLAGADRFATAGAVADFALDEGAFSGRSFGLALGSGSGRDDLADALIAGPILALSKSPLLLSQSPTNLGLVTARYLTENANRFTDQAVVFGGTGAVSAQVVAATATAVNAPIPAAPPTTPAPAPGPSISAPAAPTDAAVTRHTTGLTTLSWSTPGSSPNRAPVTGYQVTVTPSGGGTAVVDEAVQGNSVNITTGIDPSRSYTWTVRAASTAGFGQPVDSTIDPVLTPPPPPTSVTATATAGQIALGWTAAATAQTGQASATGYVLTATDGSTPAQTFSSTVVPATATSGVLTVPSGVWTVSVASTSAISGPSSATEPQTNPVTVPQVRPNPPQGVTVTAGTRAATATWSAPAPAGPDQAAVSGFRIVAVPTPSGPAVTVDVGASATSGTVPGLAPGTSYTVSVRSLSSAAGTSEDATGTPAVTPVEFAAPNAPTGATSSASGGTITATWVPAAAAGPGQAPVSGYTISASDGTTSARTTTVTGAGATTGALSGVPAGTYSVTVTANSPYAVSSAPTAAGSVTVSASYCTTAPICFTTAEPGVFARGDSYTLTFGGPVTVNSYPDILLYLTYDSYFPYYNNFTAAAYGNQLVVTSTNDYRISLTSGAQPRVVGGVTVNGQPYNSAVVDPRSFTAGGSLSPAPTGVLIQGGTLQGNGPANGVYHIYDSSGRQLTSRRYSGTSFSAYLNDSDEFSPTPRSGDTLWVLAVGTGTLPGQSVSAVYP